MNYETDIKIDETALDVEWLDQPALLMSYAQNAAEKRREYDLAKERVDVIHARLDKEIRTNPEAYEIVKITEAVVENTILLQPDYQDASTRLINAKYESELAQSAVRAVDQRKDALENLARLFGLQYFAGPKMPRDLSKEKLRKAEEKSMSKKIGTAIRSRG